MRKHKSKKTSYRGKLQKAPDPVPGRIEEIVKNHRDFTAVICDASAYSFEKAQITTKYIPGDPVVLKVVDGMLSVFIDGSYIVSLYPINDPNIQGIVERGERYHAYIFERDMKASSPQWMDFFSVIIFYKLDGVPPTDIKINS